MSFKSNTGHGAAEFAEMGVGDLVEIVRAAVEGIVSGAEMEGFTEMLDFVTEIGVERLEPMMVLDTFVAVG